MSFVVPLADLDARSTRRAGGKAANLGELARAGFPVPDGFCLTTEAYALAARRADVDPRSPAEARERLRTVDVPLEIADEARGAYRALGGGRVAVRSSATAEDLPGASFAGQQDTYLNVAGDDALLDALRRCWASLWNERAVAYRAKNRIEDEGVSLAVVVQKMVDASAAGVLFTADPITGTRGRAAIDAVRGLGDALVSGAVNPDHFLVDARHATVLERRGDTLDDARLRELAALGARVERHYGAPQDLEWAIDREGKLWVLQSRAITTLYPLPPDVPDPEQDLRVYFSANVAQGVFEPFTPLGIETFRLIASSLATAVGAPPRDPAVGPRLLVVAGMRLFLDLTPLLRDPVARSFPQRATEVLEARSARIFARLLGDERLRPRGFAPASLARGIAAVARTGAPWVVFRALVRPDATRDRVLAGIDGVIRSLQSEAGSAGERVAAFERLFLDWPRRLFPRLVGLVAPGVGSYQLATRVLRGAARPDELQRVLRGLPHNPTTEMDLALWAIARDARGDAATLEALEREGADALAERYHAGTLPPWLQRRFASFLERYGHRAIYEIDLGLPRWSEDPRHLLGAVANYLRLAADAQAPDAQFARGAREAEAMSAELLRRVHGPRRVIAGLLLRRVRALAGVREQPKFQMIRVFAVGRALIKPVGVELAARGLLDAPDDIYFLTLPELRRAVGGEDLRATIAGRRDEYRRELARRHVPRVMLSDGTDCEVTLAAGAVEGTLRGTPASPGTVSAPARVIRSPRGARLEPGEILVAPSTDPGWTPLFLTAGGLVMEMGGMMSHGAVVAREYGIPAVVGVAAATERIATGDRITADGSAGTVAIEAREPKSA